MHSLCVGRARTPKLWWPMRRGNEKRVAAPPPTPRSRITSDSCRKGGRGGRPWAAGVAGCSVPAKLTAAQLSEWCKPRRYLNLENIHSFGSDQDHIFFFFLIPPAHFLFPDKFSFPFSTWSFNKKYTNTCTPLLEPAISERTENIQVHRAWAARARVIFILVPFLRASHLVASAVIGFGGPSREGRGGRKRGEETSSPQRMQGSPPCGGGAWGPCRAGPGQHQHSRFSRPSERSLHGQGLHLQPGVPPAFAQGLGQAAPPRKCLPPAGLRCLGSRCGWLLVCGVARLLTNIHTKTRNCKEASRTRLF